MKYLARNNHRFGIAKISSFYDLEVLNPTILLLLLLKLKNPFLRKAVKRKLNS
jgi:hypothetical protein